MTTSFIPLIIDALVDLASDEGSGLDTSVSDGYRVGEEYPDDELLIGVDDATSDTNADSAQSTQEWAYIGTTERNENGSITCVSIVYNADADMKVARTRAFEIVDKLFAAITPDATLGVAGLQWVRPGEDVTLLQDQDEQGAVAAVIFKIAFFAQVT